MGNVLNLFGSPMLREGKAAGGSSERFGGFVCIDRQMTDP